MYKHDKRENVKCGKYKKCKQWKCKNNKIIKEKRSEHLKHVKRGSNCKQVMGGVKHVTRYKKVEGNKRQQSSTGKHGLQKNGKGNNAETT